MVKGITGVKFFFEKDFTPVFNIEIMGARNFSEGKFRAFLFDYLWEMSII